MIRMVFGALMVLSGIFTLSSDSKNGLMSIVFGVLFVFWGWYAWTKKKALQQSQVNREIMGYAATTPAAEATETFTFEVTGVTHECRFSPKGRQRQDVMDDIHIGDSVYLKQYEWQGKPALAVMSPKTSEDIGVAPKGCVKSILSLTGKYDASAIVVSKRYFEYHGNDYATCEVRIDCMDK